MTDINARKLKIFISSPGDVEHERAITRTVIKSLNKSNAIRSLNVVLEPVAWDVPGALPMEANIPPQEAIDRGLTRPSECQIVLVVFWMRMGTPLVMEGQKYLSGTHYEYHEALKGTDETGMPRILVYRRTSIQTPDMDDPDFDEKVEQYRTLRKFFVDEFHTNKAGTPSGAYNHYKTPAEYQKQLEGHILYIAREIADALPQTAIVEPITLDDAIIGSPFPGLRAFQEEDERIFFGRGEETFKLVEKVRKNQFVAVVGASGSGKSSLVRAGLIPRLKSISEANSWEIITFTPDQTGTHNPFESLAKGLSDANEQVDMTVELLTDADWQDTLNDTVDIILDNQTKTAKLLVFIDQFEELFTTIHEQHRDHYIDILDYFNGHDRIHVILTLRGDFFGVCIDHLKLAKLLEDSTFPLPAPGIVSIVEMITKPADIKGLEFEPGLAQRIVDDTGTEPGALALMAFALDQLYNASKHNKLTHQDYETLGLVQGAIGVRSEEVFNDMSEDEQAILSYVFRELVSVENDGTVTRQRAATNELYKRPHTRTFIEKFTEARLLVTGEGHNNQPYVEVAHEALLRSWKRLADWIRDVKEDLILSKQFKRDVEFWHMSGQVDYLLWSKERQKPVYNMQKRLNTRFTDIEQAFLRYTIEHKLEQESLRLEIENKFEAYKQAQIDYTNDKLNVTAALRQQRSIVDRFFEIGVPALPALEKLDGLMSNQTLTTGAERNIQRYIATLKRQQVIDLCASEKELSDKDLLYVINNRIYVNIPLSDTVHQQLDEAITKSPPAFRSVETLDFIQRFKAVARQWRGNVSNSNLLWSVEQLQPLIELQQTEYAIELHEIEIDFILEDDTVAKTFWNAGIALLRMPNFPEKENVPEGREIDVPEWLIVEPPKIELPDDPLAWLESLASRQGADDNIEIPDSKLAFENLASSQGEVEEAEPTKIKEDTPDIKLIHAIQGRANVSPEFMERIFTHRFDEEQFQTVIDDYLVEIKQQRIEIDGIDVAEYLENLPDFDAMPPEERMNWLETLAKRQDAYEGFITEANATIPKINPDTVDEETIFQRYIPYGWQVNLWLEYLEREKVYKQKHRASLEQKSNNTPDFDDMTPEQLMEWMESLAKRQGADEGFTTAITKVKLGKQAKRYNPKLNDDEEKIVNALNKGEDVSPEEIEEFFTKQLKRSDEYAHLDDIEGDSKPQEDVSVEIPEWLQVLNEKPTKDDKEEVSLDDIPEWLKEPLDEKPTKDDKVENKTSGKPKEQTKPPQSRLSRREQRELRQREQAEKMLNEAMDKINAMDNRLYQQWEEHIDIIDALFAQVKTPLALKEQITRFYMGSFHQRYQSLLDVGQTQDALILLCAIDLLSDKNIYVQSGALSAIEMQKDPIAIPFVEAMVESEDKEIRQKAQSVIERLQSYKKQ